MYTHGHGRFSATVYPRVCGVDRTWEMILLKAFGLSPRVRGRCRKGFKGKSRQRFIPACAG